MQRRAASEEAEKIKAHAKSELDQEVVKARNELKNQVSTLVMQGVNSVLEKEVDAKATQRYAFKAISITIGRYDGIINNCQAIRSSDF